MAQELIFDRAQLGPKTASTWHKPASTSLNIGHLGMEDGFSRKHVFYEYNVLWLHPGLNKAPKWPIVGARNPTIACGAMLGPSWSRVEACGSHVEAMLGDLNMAHHDPNIALTCPQHPHPPKMAQDADLSKIAFDSKIALCRANMAPSWPQEASRWRKTSAILA